MDQHSESRIGQQRREITHSRRPQLTERFRTLLALARDGNQEAVGDLWREFQFDFAREGGRHDVD